ncbi:MAG: hypothetical protein ACYC09_07590 [Bacteroidota bacterium]
MLTSAFLVLLTIAVMNANKMIVDRDINYYEQEAFKQAGILANSLLDEIVRKKYDDAADTSLVYQWRSEFNTAMGPGATAKNYVNPGGAPDISPFKSIRGDNANYFDDVDDYHGYIRSADAGNITGFILTVEVYYVSPANPNYKTSTQQYLKKIDVKVSHPTYLKKELTFNRIVSY